MGLVPHQRRPPRHRRQPAHQLPPHLDGLQGEPAHREKITWELGGKRSSFTLKAAPGQILDEAGEIFAWQHDPEALGNGEYTIFDDESNGPVTLLPYSWAVTVRLNLRTHVATLVKSVSQPEGMVAAGKP